MSRKEAFPTKASTGTVKMFINVTNNDVEFFEFSLKNHFIINEQVRPYINGMYNMLISRCRFSNAMKWFLWANCEDFPLQFPDQSNTDLYSFAIDEVNNKI